MTAEEYLKENKFQNPEYAGYDVALDDAREAVKMARKEEREKLTWHDLRKNPNDLPNNDRMVLIITDGHVITSKYQIPTWIHEGKYVINVIAWMDIPKFKQINYYEK